MSFEIAISDGKGQPCKKDLEQTGLAERGLLLEEQLQ